MTARNTKRPPPDRWPDDPVVAEVRRARASLWKQAGGDINAYFDLVHREAQLARGKAARRTPAKSRTTRTTTKRKAAPATRRGKAA